MFLALSATLVRPGGRVGLVLPQSLLATRDAREIRDQLEAAGAIRDLWIAGGNVFDASVLTVVLTFERSAAQGAVARWRGPTFTPAAPAAFEVGRSTWSHLLTDAPAANATTSGVLGDVAAITADFRDQYYGLNGHVHDGGSGPALVTSGLIDLGSHAWGQRPTTFMRTTYQAPRVDVSALEPKLQAWAAARLVAKVLVATQTRVLEACVDADGTLLPSVPVITVVPTTHLDPWSLAAVICSPFASAWASRESTGAALSTTAIKLSARQLAALPLPAEPWADAIEALQAGDHETFGRRMGHAYRLPDTDVFDWWFARVSGTRRRVRSRPER